MEVVEKIINNPLFVAIITLLLSTIIAIIGYLLKRLIGGNNQEKNNSIVQNFNTCVNYNDVEKIVEDVVDRKMSNNGNNKS